MINIEQLKQEVSEVTHELDRKVAMQVIDYLSEKGYLRDEWRNGNLTDCPDCGKKTLCNGKK